MTLVLKKQQLGESLTGGARIVGQTPFCLLSQIKTSKLESNWQKTRVGKLRCVRGVTLGPLGAFVKALCS
jgi:hypothetical protein